MATTVATYTNLPGIMGGPLSLRRSGQSRFALPDLQGNVRQLTDSTQTVTDTLTTDAFGVQKASSGSTVNPYKAFGGWGYFTDTPSRLYVRARHLRVDLGSWLSRDPVPTTRLSPYLYAANNPTTYIDPTGALHEIPWNISTWEIGMTRIPPSLKCCCGEFNAFWMIAYDRLPNKHSWGLAPCTGYIIQKVEVYERVFDCPSNASWILRPCYYEVIDEAKTNQPPINGDQFQRDSSSNSGFYFIRAEPKLLCYIDKDDLKNWGFEENCLNDASWKTGSCKKCNGSSDPDWWTKPRYGNGKEKPGLHWATTGWDCCPNCGGWYSDSIAYPPTVAPKPC